jgi:hypothetical protein
VLRAELITWTALIFPIECNESVGRVQHSRLRRVAVRTRREYARKRIGASRKPNCAGTDSTDRMNSLGSVNYLSVNSVTTGGWLARTLDGQGFIAAMESPIMVKRT